MDVQLPKKLPDSSNEWGTLLLIIVFATLASVGRTLSRKHITWRNVVAAVLVSVSVGVITFATIVHTTSGVSGYITVAIASASGTFTEIILSKLQSMIESRKAQSEG